MFLSNINQMDLPATWQGSRNTILSPETMLPAYTLEGGGKLPAASSKQQFHLCRLCGIGGISCFRYLCHLTKHFFENYSRYQKPVFLFFLLCGFLFLAAFVWLTAIAGRKNSDQKLHLCFFDRWPTELSAGLILLAWFPVLIFLLQCLSFADYQTDRLRATSLLDVSLLLKLMILGLYTLFWFQIGYLSLVRRIKAKQLWKNSILRRLLVLDLQTDSFSQSQASRPC